MMSGLHLRRRGRRFSNTRLRRCVGGFTAIEVMIVLAVSGFMFISALTLINGKQRVASFNQAIRNVQTELQQVANDVGSGYYPNDGTITCRDGGARLILAQGGTDTMGRNESCIFIGKIMQFGIGLVDSEQYHVYTLAGLTNGAAGAVVDLSTSHARVIARQASDPQTVPDAYDPKPLLYGLNVSKMYYNNNPANTIGAFGFTSSLGNLGGSDSSQQVNLVAVRNTDLHQSGPTGVEQINANIGPNNVLNPQNGVQICFASPAGDRSGLITIGGNGRRGSVGLRIFDGGNCT